jgi:hypothetical protein
VESPPFRAGQVGQHVVRDAFDHSLTAREGAPTSGSQGEQVAAAVRPIAVSDDLSKLLELVQEPDHVASIHRDRVAYVLLGNLAELGKTAEDLVGAERQALPGKRLVELSRRRAG